MERRGAGSNSSVYGQACVQCYKAKCRCVPRPGGCERCTRLRKQCQPSESTRNRQGVNGSSAQIAKLEGKIENLTSILEAVVKASGVQEAAIALTPPITDFWDAVRSRDNATASPSQPTNVTSEQNFHVDPSILPAIGSLYAEAPPAIPDVPTSDESDIHLRRFRERLLPCFPFMNIPSSASAGEFRRDRPFLFRAIEAVTTPSVQQHKVARFEELKRVLTQAIMLENQSNLDMLQSLLTYITWSTDPFLKRASNLSRMMMLAISLVYDLQLTKPNLPESYFIARMAPGLAETDQKAPADSAEDSLEQHRAVLACFALSSIISTYFRRINSMQWTPQMEDSMHFVEKNAGGPSDEAFIFQVRLQALAQKATTLRERHVGDSSQSTSVAAGASAGPVLLYTKVLREQLQELRSSLSPVVEQREILLVYAHYVDLCISEATRLASSEAPLLATGQPPGAMGGELSGFEKIECLWRSVHAINSWLDAFKTVAPATYVGMPFFYWFQFVRCVILAKHLMTFRDPAWDPQTVYNTFDLIGVLGWLATKMELASKEAGEQSDDDLFRRLGRMLRNSLAWIDAKRNTADGETAGSACVFTSSNENIATGSIDSAWMEGVQLGDDAWFEEYLGWSPAVGP
ncbi:hypothetical protein F5Y18DRAFT_377094 [Xylariaceae sp. FL1019]|nr:hypothetical protein F5Y18DRAFT_377094 [Xylariaceae sp. FL1019]